MLISLYPSNAAKVKDYPFFFYVIGKLGVKIKNLKSDLLVARHRKSFSGFFLISYNLRQWGMADPWPWGVGSGGESFFFGGEGGRPWKVGRRGPRRRKTEENLKNCEKIGK